jgi:hypothetical protein
MEPHQSQFVSFSPLQPHWSPEGARPDSCRLERTVVQGQKRLHFWSGFVVNSRQSIDRPWPLPTVEHTEPITRSLGIFVAAIRDGGTKEDRKKAQQQRDHEEQRPQPTKAGPIPSHVLDRTKSVNYMTVVERGSLR